MARRKGGFLGKLFGAAAVAGAAAAVSKLEKQAKKKARTFSMLPKRNWRRQSKASSRVKQKKKLRNSPTRQWIL